MRNAGVLRGVRARLRVSAPYLLAARIRQSLSAAPRVDYRVISLGPANAPRGSVLLSYIDEIGVLLEPEERVPVSHTHFRELRLMARTLVELGYRVDVIDYLNHRFLPVREYALFIDSRWNMQRLAPMLGSDCVRMMHLDTRPILFQDAAEFRRLLELQQRRGVTLAPHRYEPLNLGIEHADCAVMLGNDHTLATWRYAGKPIYPICVPGAVRFPAPEAKDFEACRHRFLWMGSYGLVHKGLDLVLEAFAGMPELELLVCGPVGREPEFERAYERELYHTANIRTLGWVDPGSAAFAELVRGCVALVYPSCSEGQAGSVVTALHAGLVPIVSAASGVTIEPELGILLRDCSIEEIRGAVRHVAALSAMRLRSMARRAWERARRDHTDEAYCRRYRQIIEDVVALPRARQSDGGTMAADALARVATADGAAAAGAVPERAIAAGVAARVPWMWGAAPVEPPAIAGATE